MKQVININLQGQVIPIESSSFDILKKYIDALNKYFINEVGKEEIINDIEGRIAELFQEVLKKGSNCITDADIHSIIKSIGNPEEFDGDATASEKNNYEQSHGKKLYRDENNRVIGGVCAGIANHFGIEARLVRILFVIIALIFGSGLLAYIVLWAALPSSAHAEIGSARKKLFRNPDEKIIAGVASGLGAYFGINPWIPRIIFLLPFLSFAVKWTDNFLNILNLSFSPGAIVAYIICWLAIPEAHTNSEKLEMRGEKIDIDSIKKSVETELKATQKSFKRFSEEGKKMGEELKTNASSGIKTAGKIILFFIKSIAYFIVGIALFAITITLFAITVASISVFPLRTFLISDGWQNILSWGTLLFFITTPLIGIITWVIRRIAKLKGGRKPLRVLFIGLWIIGWSCFISLIALIGHDFQYKNEVKEEVMVLTNPSTNRLIIKNKNDKKFEIEKSEFSITPFNSYTLEKIPVNNVTIKIMKSYDDSFRVSVIKRATGKNITEANRLAEKIKFEITQKDSLLFLDNGFFINRSEKFRNQQIIVTVYVPEGKQIMIDKEVESDNNVIFEINNGIQIHNQHETMNWEKGQQYIMQADGLYNTDGTKAERKSHERRENEWKEDGEKTIDSLRQIKKEIEKKLDNLGSISKKENVNSSHFYLIENINRLM